MQKVANYKLIVCNSSNSLSKEVASLIAKRWIQSGSVVVFGDQLIQAMVQFESN
jgi:predicted RecA/RadA family phage recombinase